jgi:multiple sugar transport system permease protein
LRRGADGRVSDLVPLLTLVKSAANRGVHHATPRAHSIVWSVIRHLLLLARRVHPATVPVDDIDGLKPQTEIFSSDCTHPYHFALWDNLRTAFAKADLWRYLLNGLIVTISIFGLQVLVALPAAYALAKLRFLGRDVLFALVVFCILIPPQATAIPVFLLLHKLGVLDSYAALVLPFTISVFGIFLMRQFFKTVPDDLIDAARMDGISEFGIVWRVMLPTAIPAVTAFGIFSVVAHWNDYFWPLIGSASIYAAARRAAFRNEGGTNYGADGGAVSSPAVGRRLLARSGGSSKAH